MDGTSLSLIIKLSALLIAITFHEFMHAWTANYLGDPTAKNSGRVSLNPVAHFDLYGSFLVPLFLVLVNSPILFGWAKPVPVSPNNFKNYRAGQILTSIAGPLANLVLILVFTVIYKLLPTTETIFGFFVFQVIVTNIWLMVFNLIPIPPLDGSKLLYGFLPFETMRKIEIYGPFLLIPFIFLFAPYILTPAINLVLRVLGL